MVSRLIKLSYFLLLFAGFNSTVHADVELPFEFFYGRWVDGHYVNTWYSVEDFEFDFSIGGNEYLFTKNSLQVKVAGLGNHILWDELDWGDNRITKRSPTIDMNLRPSNKWQLGINDFYIFNSIYSFNINSTYMSDSTIKISESHAPYAYLYNIILSKGNFILENRFNYRKSSSNNIYNTNTIKYGLTDDINLSARITANEIESVSSFSPSYNFSVLSGLLAPFYVEMSIGQSFFDSKFKNRFLTNLVFNMTYISNGKFDHNIIIADYNNYYKKMLFKNQFLLSLDIQTREIDTHNDLHENDDFWMQLKSAYGISSKVNVELQFKYSNNYSKSIRSYYERFTGYIEEIDIFSSENVSSSLNFSYFSQPYSSTPINKWETDSKYNIVLGNILKAKEFYLKFSFSPPSYNDRDERKFDILGFNSLKSNGRLIIDYSSLIGVGKDSEVGVNINYSHHNNRLYTYLIEVSGRKRVRDKIYISFELLKSFSQALGSTIILGSYNPYRITAQLKLLL